jgi:hypothetical protein
LVEVETYVKTRRTSECAAGQAHIQRITLDVAAVTEGLMRDVDSLTHQLRDVQVRLRAKGVTPWTFPEKVELRVLSSVITDLVKPIGQYLELIERLDLMDRNSPTPLTGMICRCGHEDTQHSMYQGVCNTLCGCEEFEGSLVEARLGRQLQTLLELGRKLAR